VPRVRNFAGSGPGNVKGKEQEVSLRFDKVI
jgi:hypothetical protein